MVWTATSPDLLGSMQKGANIVKGVQQINLLKGQLDQNAKELVLKQKQDEFNRLTKMLDVPNQSPDYYQGVVDQLAPFAGLQPGALTLGDNYKNAVKEISGVIESKKKNPALDVGPAISSLKQKYGSSANIKNEIDLLNGQLSKITSDTMQNFLSLLTGSGGIKPGEEQNLLGTLATKSGNPDLRAAAAARIAEQTKSAGKPTLHNVPANTDVLDAQGKKVYSKGPAPGSNQTFKESDYRGLLGQAASNALRTMKFNDPSQLELIYNMKIHPDQAEALNQQLQRSMNPEQRAAYDKSIGDYMRANVPKQFLGELESRLNRVVVPNSGPRGISVVIPGSITHVSQAVPYLQKTYGMSREEAIAWLNQNSEAIKK
jgi:hypothetical protein